MEKTLHSATSIQPECAGSSGPSSAAPEATFSADVLAYADRNQITPYLQPLLDATREIFRGAERIRVFFQEDPEVPGDATIIYHVRASALRYPQSWSAHKVWNSELTRICPAPLTCYFSLLLDLGD
jgi:hypothetical protein